MIRLAYVGLDRQIHTVGPRGEDPRQLTAPDPTGVWSTRARAQDAWAWPTWSPDGEWIACFVVEGSDEESGPVRILTLSTDGVRQVEWHQLQGASPIYLQWHSSGSALTVLTQQDEELHLGLLHRDHLGTLRPLESGIPLFFNWTPDGSRVLIHAGNPGRPGGRLVLRDPLGDAEDVLYPDDPGSFCAPVFPGGIPVYCTPAESGESQVVSAEPDGTQRQVLWSSRGLVSIVAAPHGGPRVAVSSAPRGEGTPYRGIDVVDLDGSTRRVTDADCMAYFWCPTGEALLYASVDTRENCITWHRVTLDGATRSIATFWPTRDTLFYLHFFDQYASSHPVISPDGRWLAFAGYPAGGGQADLSAPPRIYVKDLHDLERPAAEVGNGHFAVFPTSVPLVDGWQAPR